MWRALHSGKVRVRWRMLKDASALIETPIYDKSRAVITIDGFRAGELEGLVHELSHHVVTNEWPEGLLGAGLEEAIVGALEDTMVRYINRNPREVARWRAAVKRIKSRGKA